MTLNPNWPVVDFAVSWGFGPAQDPSTATLWCDLTSRTEGKVGTRRGKTYELDQVQPGSATLTLRNDDGALDPANTSSPFAGSVLPYRLFRARAQWPPTPNLLLADQATAFYASKGAGGAGSALPPFVWAPSGHTTTVVNVGTKNHYQSPIVSGAAGSGVHVGGFSVEPGGTYTAQAMLSVAGGSVLCEVALLFSDIKGNWTTHNATATIGAAGQLLEVTATAPAGAVGGEIYIDVQGTPAFAGSLDVWDVQLEPGSSASAWQQPGEWYPLFTGYVERWPQTWSSGGNYGVSNLTVVDLFSFLANRGLDWVGYLEMLSLNPDWFYPLDEGQGATLFRDLTGKRPPIQVNSFWENYKGAPANFQPGQQLFTGTKAPVGVPGPVVLFGNPDNSGYAETDVLDLSPIGGDVIGPPVNAGTGWTRILAVNPGYPTLPSASSGSRTMWFCSNTLTENGNPGFWLWVSNGQGSYPIKHGIFMGEDIGVIGDGNWHLIAMGFSGDGKTIYVWVDGKVAWTGVAGSDAQPHNNWFDWLGGWPTPSGSNGYPGPMSFVAQLPYLATTAQMAGLFQAFQRGWGTTSGSPAHTETSDSRYARLLGWVGNAAQTRISPGASLEYGAATDFQGGTTPTSTLSALQAVVDTECGQHFVAADGAIVFQSRRDRFNVAPVLTFGELAGEVPYESVRTDFDPTRVGNSVTTTAQNPLAAASSTATAEDSASVSDYGTMTFSRTVNTIDAGELLYVAEGLLYQNRQPLQRLEALPINVAANPSTWPQLLALELGSCVKVNRRPANAPAFSVTGFVEQIVWSLADNGQASCSLQVTSNQDHLFCALDDPTYGLLDSTAILGF